MLEVGEVLPPAFHFSGEDLLLRMEKRLVRKESEGNGQGLRECLCEEERDMLRRMTTSALREPSEVGHHRPDGAPRSEAGELPSASSADR